MADKKLSLILGAKDRLSSVLIGASKKSDKAFAKLSKRIDSISKGFDKVGNTAKKAGAVMFTALSATAGILYGLAAKTSSYGDRIDKMSQKIGMSRKMFQEWDYVMSQNDGNIESLKMGYKTLSSQMAQVDKKGSKTATLFRNIGVSVKDSNGKFKSQEVVFKNTVKALQKIKNPTQKAILANKLFGRSAIELKPLLNSNAESIDKLVSKAHQLGMIRTDAEIDACVKFTDTIDTLKHAFMGMGATLGMQIIPYAQQLSDKLIANIPVIKSQILPNLASLVKVLGHIVIHYGKTIAILSGSIMAFGAFNSAVSTTLTTINNCGKFLRGFNKIIKTYRFTNEVKALYALSGGFRAVGVAIAGTPIGWIALGVTAIVAGAILIRKYWTPITQLFKGFGEGLKTSLTPAFDKFKIALKPLAPVFNKIGQVLAPVVKFFKSLFVPINTTGKASHNLGVTIGKLAGEYIKFVIKMNPLILSLRMTYKLLKGIGNAAKYAGQKLQGIKLGNNKNNINGSHANGLSNVPFDGYIAELHKGERVLTANENKIFNRQGQGIKIVFAPVINADKNTDIQSIENIVKEQCNRFIANINERAYRKMIGAYNV